MSRAKRLTPGAHFLMGNLALAEGALSAGCDFFAGYPITPASEILNHLAALLPASGGVLLQAEDEISAICAAVGASWSGRRAMTATSGPGLSLMQETVGLAAATETPLVIVDVQRLGPSTGVPSVGLSGDVVQVARGSHGDYQIIALAPESPQEMFDLTVRAFDLAERFRVPVFVLADAFMGHMRERVVIPDRDSIRVACRKLAAAGTTPYQRQDFLDPDVAPMPVFGLGLQAHVTSSCHDGRGMRNLSDPQVMHDYVTKPIQKILGHRGEIVEVEADYGTGDVLLLAYGSVARAAKAAVRLGRGRGLNVGCLRLKTLWPLPEEEISAAADQARRVIVLENNTGQLFPYLKAAAGRKDTLFLGPRILGQIHEPEHVLNFIQEAGR